MKKIFESKISIQSLNSKYSYSLIRLPRKFKGIAGKIASIYETEQDGALAFLVVVDKLVDKSQENNLESRFPALEPSIEALESKIDKLIELNFQNNELIESKSLKKHGLGRIRTGDLRRVKARNSLNSLGF